ncbi:MAG: DUF3465 domain-containing protein [Candidatus Eremiobacteraeota bacterium]|nr:DUF3465 domain-containing protein [Candidatus Eremiobacteraeota bacterium]
MRCAAIAALFVALAACAPSQTSDSNGDVYDAWRAQRSRVEVTASGSIVRLLGNRVGRSGEHAGFLLHLRGAAGHGLTVRVEDNVDLTGRLELTEGADAEVRGEYIYTARGGVIHYTHRDPRGHHAAGYVRTGGRFYQ